MQLVGSTFCCEVPQGWSEVREPGCVVASAPEQVLGFTPNVVLRESRVPDRPDSLAAISQANLRAIHDELPGTLVIDVEAVNLHGAEHRRIWTLIPVTPESLHGNILCLLSIQDLMVVDEVVAELTVTVPLVEWEPGDQYQAILDTLQPMPLSERVAPATVSTVPAAVLDQWATERDGRPREDLSVVTSPKLVLQAEPITLSEVAATTFLERARARVFSPVTGEVRAELTAADLVDEHGSLTGAGFWYADHLLSGDGWTITVAGPTPRQFQFWVTDTTTVFAAPHPHLAGRRLLGYCPSNDLFRLVLAWAEVTPAWPLDVHLELTEDQLRTKLEEDRGPQHTGDPGEFIRQQWTLLTLVDAEDEPHLNWIHTSSRGDAVTWFEESLHNSNNLITVRQHPEAPFWAHLISVIADNSKDQQ